MVIVFSSVINSRELSDRKMDRFKVTKADHYESTDDDDGEGKTVTSSLLEMKELNGPRYEGRACRLLYNYHANYGFA